MKKLILFIAVIMFSCGENNEEQTEQTHFIVVETICKSGDFRTYEITDRQRYLLESYFEAQGIDCTWTNFKTIKGTPKKGFFVRYKD